MVFKTMLTSTSQVPPSMVFKTILNSTSQVHYLRPPEQVGSGRWLCHLVLNNVLDGTGTTDIYFQNMNYD